MSGVRILVTGGGGFIGSHVVEHLQHEAHVVVLDNFSSGCRSNLEGLTCEVIEGDILHRSTVRSAVEGVDYVFHMAAMVSVPESMSRPVECCRINSEGTLVVLEEAARAGVKKLCFSSSAAVYGENPAPRKKEDMTPDPRSPYAVSKLDGEYYCRIFRDEGRLNTVCMRYFNVFGPRQNPNSAYAAAVPAFISHALSGRPLTVFGDGEQTRDFIYVGDVAAANAYIARHDTSFVVYNVAHGRKITINELACAIIKRCHSSSAVEHAEPRPGDIRDSMADVTRLQSAGFEPQYDMNSGLQRTVDFFTNSEKVRQP